MWRPWEWKGLFHSHLTNIIKASQFHNQFQQKLLKKEKNCTRLGFIWSFGVNNDYDVYIQDFWKVAGLHVPCPNNSQHTIYSNVGLQEWPCPAFFRPSSSCRAEPLIRGLNVWNGKDQSKAKGLSNCMKSNNMTRTRRALCTSVTIDPFLNLLFQLDRSYQWPAYME